MMKCRKCGRLNPDGSSFCDRCGASLVKEPVPIQSRECPSCGTLNPGSAIACSNCGTTLPSLYEGGGSTVPLPESRAQVVDWSRVSASVRSQKPSVAGVLMIGAGIVELLTAMRGFMAHFPQTDVPIDVSGFVLFCSSFVLLMGLIVIAGSYMAFRRGSFTLTLIATIAGMLGVGAFYLGFLMSLIALVLVALSKDEFLE